MKLKYSVTLEKCIFFIGVAWFLFGVWLSTRFSTTRPTTPDAIDGNIYQMISHGKTVYLTLKEFIFLNFCLLVPLGAVALTISYFHNRKDANTA